MLLILKKTSTFLFLFCLWAFFAANAFAQNEQPAQKAAIESSSANLKLETETQETAVLGKSNVDKPIDAPSNVQAIENREKNISAEMRDAADEKNELINADLQREASGFKYNFLLSEKPETPTAINEAVSAVNTQFSFRKPNTASFEHLNNSASPDDDAVAGKKEGFRWRSAIKQSLMFLAIQHGYAFTQPKTRDALKGKFWKDYADSVKSLHGWEDGGRFFTNYIAHPMQGAFTGFLYVQNDSKATRQQFGKSGDYWRSRLKAMAWTAAWSTQFEIGLFSQASIGNVGLKGKQTYIDIVITPTVGTAMLIAEDAVDRFIMKRIERSTDNFYVRIFSRMLLSPTRTIANLFRFKEPWYRDRPLEH